MHCYDSNVESRIPCFLLLASMLCNPSSLSTGGAYGLLLTNYHGKGKGILQVILRSLISWHWVNQKGDYPFISWALRKRAMLSLREETGRRWALPCVLEASRHLWTAQSFELKASVLHPHETEVCNNFEEDFQLWKRMEPDQ